MKEREELLSLFIEHSERAICISERLLPVALPDVRISLSCREKLSTESVALFCLTLLKERRPALHNR